MTIKVSRENGRSVCLCNY